MKAKKTRADKWNDRADAVCREVRYQIAQVGGIYDNARLGDLLGKWYAVSRKSRWSRPPAPGKTPDDTQDPWVRTLLALADQADARARLPVAKALRAVVEAIARDDLPELAEAVDAYRRGLDGRKPLTRGGAR